MTCWQQLRSKSDFCDVTLVCADGKVVIILFNSMSRLYVSTHTSWMNFFHINYKKVYLYVIQDVVSIWSLHKTPSYMYHI